MTLNQPNTGFLAQSACKPAWETGKCGVKYKCMCKVFWQKNLYVGHIRLLIAAAATGARAEMTDSTENRSGVVAEATATRTVCKAAAAFSIMT
ncbi:hypothetical protein V1281_003301 [Nitrobacteraceae bacterium AZCC 2161]